MKTTLTFIGLIFVTSLLYLSKQFYNPRLKNLIIGSSLIQLPIAYHVLSVSFNRASVIMNFKYSAQTICLQWKYYMPPTKSVSSPEKSTSNYSGYTDQKKLRIWTLFTRCTAIKMESKNSRLYLKVVFILSGDVNCNPGSVMRHQINDPKFEAFNSRRLHFMHVNIDSLLPKVETNYVILSNIPVLS